MSKYVIQGGDQLKGEIRVAGNKNAVLPMMAAALLTEEDVYLNNVPYIRDVDVMEDILVSLGAEVERDRRQLRISSAGVNSYDISPELARRLRASVLFVGPLLARFGRVRISHPGGDIIGKRGIETHLGGMANVGISISRDDLLYTGRVEAKKGGRIFLDQPSVTATENLLMYASLSEEETIIENAAAEPHIVCLADLLRKMGAKIDGDGTSEIRMIGRKKLSGTEHKVAFDFIEAGTFAILSSLTGGDLKIKAVSEKDMQMISLVLRRMGIETKFSGDNMSVNKVSLRAMRRSVQAAPWPGFPTDLMSPFIVLATQAEGQMLCHDPMYESRMFFVDKLISMGARITICDPHRVIVYGQTPLYGRHLSSPDIRAGMALVIASLIAEGESVIDHAEIVERGYERLAERLSEVGASIKRK